MFAGGSFPPIKQGVAVEVALIHQIVVGRDDIFQIVERIISRNLIRHHVFGASPQ